MLKPLDTTQKRWFLAIGYVLFIYATLGVVRIPVQFLRSLGILRLTLLIIYMACSAWILFQVYKRQPKSMARYFGLVGIFVVYALVSRQLASPEEQIHFLEYGLVGVLFVRALETKRPFGGRIVFVAALMGSLAGWVDEIIQGLLPSRHYDIHDIYLNILSVCLGLAIYALIPGKSTPQFINPNK